MSGDLGLFADDPGMQAAARQTASARRAQMLARWRTVSSRPTTCTDHKGRRGCGGAIRWVLTAESWMPLDPEPNPDGNITIVRDGAAQIAQVRAADITAPGPPAGERYTPHFATCPHADQHRRPR